MSARRLRSDRDDDPGTITLWIVEDDDLFRSGLADLLNSAGGMRCEHALRSCEEAFKLLEKVYAPEVVLMDIGLPGVDGIEGVRRIKAVSPATDLMMLTIHEDDQKVFDSICAGASGYLLKSSPPGEIVRAINEVLAGGAPMNAQIARKVLTMFAGIAAPKSDYGLTDREKEILKLTTEGLTKKAIADRLFLSYFTIDTHLKNIYLKLQVHSRGGAVAKALKENLL